ncbi:hypothetical protein WUBG_17130 [Wuchereria bancrofti]|uniref:Uncharacterized protein n=1 Tax=Wuchereria bancrofti TaxID=6293 RepID=J9E998_WUCBA|nr:hypothetical protein WUBG_17130 [Wuchereria bancrofti]
MQDVCSGGSSDADNSDTIYTQQQITAMDADCMYNRRQQLAAVEQPNTMNAYHQDLLPPIHETLTSFRQPSSLLNDMMLPGSHRHHLQNQMTSTDVERSLDNFERSQQHVTAQPSGTSKNTTVMQDVCSGGSSDADNSDTIYTQQQITAMDADCMYNRRQQLAAVEQPNTMNAYHQGSYTVFYVVIVVDL